MMKGATIQKITTAILVLLIALTIYAAPVSAQEPVQIEAMRVDIWPEYDRPSVLVIYHITLSSETTLPANLSIRLPAQVGEPHAVAMSDPTGLYNLNYEIEPAGAWKKITFTTPIPDVRIEYYDPALDKNGATRSFTFSWPGDYTVNNLLLTVQQPAGATNMGLKPNMGSSTQGEDGLTYYSLVAGKVNAGTTFDLTVGYDKQDDTLTSESQFQPASPSQPLNETTAGRVNPSQVLPWALGGAGLLLIAAGFFWYFKTGRIASEPSRPRHGRKDSEGQAESRTESAFCHQCGKKAAPGDTFCRTCGSKLK